MRTAKDKTIEALEAEVKWLRAELEATHENHYHLLKDWQDERRQLLNRIQAPESAEAQGYEPDTTFRHVPLDDDNAWQEERERLMNG